MEPTQSDYGIFYDSLINEAPYISGDSCDLIPPNEIPWIQPNLLNKSRQFYRENILALSLAHTVALVHGLSLKNESVVLLRTGKFNNEKTAFFRFISTAARIETWYDDDILSVDSKAYQNLQLVRQMHERAAKSKKPLPYSNVMQPTKEKSAICEAIRSDLQNVDTSEAPAHLMTWTSPLEFSQFDMAMTQFGFIAVVYKFPNLVGMRDQKSLNGFLHLWAVIGRLLGIEDRFNVALHPDPALYDKLINNIIIASLKNSDMTTISLQHTLMSALGKRLPFVSLKAFLYMGFNFGIPDFQGKNLYKIMNWYDKMCYGLMIATFRLMTRVPFIRKILNWFVRCVFKIGQCIYLPKKEI